MEVNAAQKQVEGRVEVIALFWRPVLLSVRIGLRSCCAVPCVRDGRLAQAVLDAKPAKVRLTPQIGTAYRTTLARLHQTLVSSGQPEAVDAARALIRQFRYGSHHSAAFRSDSRIPPIQHQSRAKTCEGSLVTGRTSSATHFVQLFNFVTFYGLAPELIHKYVHNACRDTCELQLPGGGSPEQYD